MRRFVAVLSIVMGLVAVSLPNGGARAGMLAAPGPNPNWTEMQQFEWYIGYLASAARTCGTHTAAGVLQRLARMSAYGRIGLNTVRGDGFAGPVCGGINNDARDLAADAKRIEEYLETTYNCEDEGCFGQELNSWQTHACADALEAHLASRAVDKDNVSEVTIYGVGAANGVWNHQARVRFKNCEGSLYVDLKKSCAVTNDYTRGDCDVEGVERY